MPTEVATSALAEAIRIAEEMLQWLKSQPKYYDLMTQFEEHKNFPLTLTAKQYDDINRE